jgi:hypothetical protein
MGLHCHQPVDNFRRIFEEAYRKSYKPFLDVLEQHPAISLTFHYSGPVLEWLIGNRPEFVERLRRLLKKGQIEILTGGYYEPVLAMIPPRDARGQIAMLNDSLKEHLRYRADGIWLAERIWDPSLLSLLEDLNVRYTVLDDHHLRLAGNEADDVFGHYTVRGARDDFSVFASVKKLRYTMPFREPDVTIDFLRKLSEKPGVRCATFADDCEKFGLWPYTYNLVYKKKWLDRFFTALEKSDWVKTATFGTALKEIPSSGTVGVPHASYAEMMQWCGNNFNNFFKKYHESDTLRKRMLSVSDRLQKVKSGTGDASLDARLITGATRELYKSQSNCTYWHGVFGGIYINYLRQGTYRHIIQADALLSQDGEKAKLEMVGNVLCARNQFLNVFIDPDYAGSVFALDHKPSLTNLVDTVSRRYEPYHETLKRKRRMSKKTLKERVDRDEAIDLYEVLGTRERNLERFLVYDSYKRYSGLCHVMDPGTSFNDFMQSTHADTSGDSLFGPHEFQAHEQHDRLVVSLRRDGHVRFEKTHLLRLNKCIILEKDAEVSFSFDLENISAHAVKLVFGVEFNWSIEDDSFMKTRNKRRVRSLTLTDKYRGVKIGHFFEEPVSLWSFPVYTLNESERGIGRNFQEVALLFHKKVDLDPGQRFSLMTKLRISK